MASTPQTGRAAPSTTSGIRRSVVEMDDGASISYVAVDLRPPWAPPAAPLFLLHGLGLSLEVWRPWIAALASERQVVAIDLRGHGGSADAWLEDRYAIDRFVEDVERVADAVGLERFHFAGESFGGTIGLKLAAARPDRVVSVTTCSTAFDGARIANVAHWPDLVAEPGGIERWSEEILGGRLGPDPDPALARWLFESQRGRPPRVVAGIVEILRGTDLTEELSVLPSPVLVISPDRSPFVDPTNAEALAAAALHGELALVSGAFHGIVLTHWRECVARLSEFLARVEGVSSRDGALGGPSEGGLDGGWTAGIGSHVAIEVPDLAAALRFYRDLLGLEEDWRHAISGGFLESVTGLEDATGEVAQLLCPGGSRIELWCHRPHGGDGARGVNDNGLDHVSFGVRDVRRVYERLAAAGVPFTVEPVDVADPDHPLFGWQAAYFEDPWGTRLEIVGPDPERGLDNGERRLGRAR